MRWGEGGIRKEDWEEWEGRRKVEDVTSMR